jgi:hypothetical protein
MCMTAKIRYKKRNTVVMGISGTFEGCPPNPKKLGAYGALPCCGGPYKPVSQYSHHARHLFFLTG